MLTRLNLTWKLVCSGVAIVLISVICMGALSSFTLSRDMESKSRNDVVSIAGNIADLVQIALTQEMHMLKEITFDDNVIDTATIISRDGSANAVAQIQSFQRKLANIQNHIGQNYQMIIAFDLKGVVFADSMNGLSKGVQAADREYFKFAKEGKYNVGKVVKSKTTGKPVVHIAGPILTETKEIVGVLAISIKIDYLVDKIASVKLGQTGYAFMTDENGNIIAHPNMELILNTNINDEQGMESISKAVLSAEAGVDFYSFRGEKKIGGYAPIPMSKWNVMTSQPVNELRAPIIAMQKQMALLGAFLLAVFTGAVFLFGRSISRPIIRTVNGLTDASEQVASASNQIADTSRQFAEGASEQAASLEEITSSLEELASMTKQNAENAMQSQTIVKKSVKNFDEANQVILDLTHSMQEIDGASKETQKIIKTIDEIAFQTNLLALNAAVEAARAGEAGSGFAVVADEVRNLALRAAEAAKNTAVLIEGTVRKVQHGSALVVRAEESFSKVKSDSTSISNLVTEIAAASSEQAEGIAQINRAVNEMDKVTQQNAANAEESASASEEMNARALQMGNFVSDLTALVGVKKDWKAKRLQSLVTENCRVQVTASNPANRKALTHSCNAAHQKGSTEHAVLKRSHLMEGETHDSDF